MSRVGTRRGRQADLAKREAIIIAAMRHFFASGFAATSIEQVAADAGVSKVTVYSHFGDKQALFVAAVENQCRQISSELSIEPATAGTLRERLTMIGEAIVAFLSRPEVMQFDRRIAAETEHDPQLGLTFLAAGPHRLRKNLAEQLCAMNAAGEVRLLDFDLAAEQFVSMCKGMGDLERLFGYRPDPARDRERIEGAVEVFCRAYGTV